MLRSADSGEMHDTQVSAAMFSATTDLAAVLRPDELQAAEQARYADIFG
jgi:hypothetical protein